WPSYRIFRRAGWRGRVEGPGVQSMSLPKATAVSAMRLEKPHSLSYQDSTDTKLPSITLVWSSATVEECGSWLKSIDTFGRVVTLRMPFSRLLFEAANTASLISWAVVARPATN